MASGLDGPRLAPKSGAPRQLVVFLHGYGADGSDLIEIGRQWRQWLPDASFVSPNAPERCMQSPTGRQWFALTMRDPGERWRGALAARPAIDAFLDNELARLGLDDSRLALVGFSQGAMMALHVGLRRPRAPAAILSYSGALIGPERLEEAKARNARGEPPPILLVHGSEDGVIPIDSLFASAEALASAGLPVQWRLSLGVGHGIDHDAIVCGGQFLAQSFGLPTPERPRA
jgi:phospholipase/carboxylesterase